MVTRSETVSVPESIIQDIAVLKSQYAELGRRVDEGNRATQQAVANLSGRLELMHEVMQTIAKLTTQHEEHSNGLNRAFEEIKATDLRQDEFIREEASWRKDHERENAAVERKLSMWHGIALGVTMMLGAVTGVAMWSGGRVMQALQGSISDVADALPAIDARLDKLERDAAKEHAK